MLQASAKAKDRRARDRASRLLRRFAFDCPAVAEDLSGMGSAWLASPNAASGEAGLAGDLFAVSAIRLGTRAANYAVWSASNASAREAMSRSQHSEVLHAAKVAKSLSPRQCKKKAFDRPSLLSPGKSHPWGCPEVAPRDFATRCLRSRGESLPCVLRGAAADLLKKDFPLDRPLEPWLATGGNETVKVSFPYEGLGGVASLNRIEGSSRVLERQGANRSDGAPAWALLRPGNWHMRLADAVAFAERHPSQAIYMNQVMLPDLGAKALQMLRTPAWAKTLKLVQPSLWLTADVALTGFHTDGPENLLAQLSGSKELTLLRPSEKSKLAYEANTTSIERAQATRHLMSVPSRRMSRPSCSTTTTRPRVLDVIFEPAMSCTYQLSGITQF
ncbi:unnamed protein product [Symbiodinium sp. CCMP2456]|nr:unnamed protein product [Symbiodinium sp. CCMP2456]